MIWDGGRWTALMCENHSGMETWYDSICEADGVFGCVRTIVVWKHNYIDFAVYPACRCVRTIVVWKLYKQTSFSIIK